MQSIEIFFWNVKYVRFQGLMILINMNNETYLSSDGSWIMYPRIVDTMLCNLPCMNSFFTYRLMTPLFTLLTLLLQVTINAWNVPQQITRDGHVLKTMPFHFPYFMEDNAQKENLIWIFDNTLMTCCCIWS